MSLCLNASEWCSHNHHGQWQRLQLNAPEHAVAVAAAETRLVIGHLISSYLFHLVHSLSTLEARPVILRDNRHVTNTSQLNNLISSSGSSKPFAPIFRPTSDYCFPSSRLFDYSIIMARDAVKHRIIIHTCRQARCWYIVYCLCLYVCFLYGYGFFRPKIKLAASNLARRFIGYQCREWQIFVNFATPKAPNRTNSRGPRAARFVR